MQITKSQKRKIFGISSIFVCLLGMSPSFTQGDEWPGGSYGLPRPKSGCPSSKKNGWYEGWRFQDMEDSEKSTRGRSRVSSGSHMDVTLIGYKRDVNRTFCMKQNTGIQTRFWPKGSYCVYKSKDAVCPKDMTSGWVRWDDEDYINYNEKGGSLPDGLYDQDTEIKYCCQTDGNWYDSIELPVSQSFYLLTSNSNDSPKCQMVKWAFSYLEYIVFDTNDNNNRDWQGGEHLFKNGEKLYYCYYEDCRRTMTCPSGSFRSHKAAVTEMDPRSQYCSWLITLAVTYIVSLNFKELTIPSCDDTFLRIYDGPNDAAPLLGTYCGSSASTEVVVLSSTNSLYIVSNSGSYARSPKNTFTFHAQYKAENLTDKEKTDDSSRIIIITTTVGGVVFLCIVLIVLLIKYKRRTQAPKLSTPVNIPLAVEIPQEPLPIDQEPGYETVAIVNRREFYNDVATNANESEDISAEGRTSHYEEVGVPSNAHKTSGYETPSPHETYEEPIISQENPGYTELDKNRLQGRNATDDGTYQKLVKRDSDYVIPAHERRESYEDIRMERNLPGYTQLDLSKREADDYQKFVKT